MRSTSAVETRIQAVSELFNLGNQDNTRDGERETGNGNRERALLKVADDVQDRVDRSGRHPRRDREIARQGRAAPRRYWRASGWRGRLMVDAMEEAPRRGGGSRSAAAGRRVRDRDVASDGPCAFADPHWPTRGKARSVLAERAGPPYVQADPRVARDPARRNRVEGERPDFRGAVRVHGHRDLRRVRRRAPARPHDGQRVSRRRLRSGERRAARRIAPTRPPEPTSKTTLGAGKRRPGPRADGRGTRGIRPSAAVRP